MIDANPLNLKVESFENDSEGLNLDCCGEADLTLFANYRGATSTISQEYSTGFMVEGKVQLAMHTVVDSVYTYAGWWLNHSINGNDTVFADSVWVLWRGSEKYNGELGTATENRTLPWLARLEAGTVIDENTGEWTSGKLDVRRSKSQSQYHSTIEFNGNTYDYYAGTTFFYPWWTVNERAYVAMRMQLGGHWRYGWIEIEPKSDSELLVHSWALQD